MKHPIKTTKKQRIEFLSVLKKLTDSRFNFSMYNHYEEDSWSLRVDMLFCNSYVSSSKVVNLSELTAIEALKELIIDASEKNEYFKQFGVCFQIKKACTKGNVKFMFRKHDESKFVNISKSLAKALVSDNELVTGMSRQSEISFCEYTDIMYFRFNGDV